MKIEGSLMKYYATLKFTYVDAIKTTLLLSISNMDNLNLCCVLILEVLYIILIFAETKEQCLDYL